MTLCGMELSCNRSKLEKVVNAAMGVMAKFYGLTREDKEDIMVDVLYRFEVDGGKFPISVYKAHCHNKVVGFLGKKTALKRMAQTKDKNGKRIYFPDISLDMQLRGEDDEEGGGTLSNFIVQEDYEVRKAEIVADVALRSPYLATLVEKVLNGGELTRKERAELRQEFTKEDFTE